MRNVLTILTGALALQATHFVVAEEPCRVLNVVNAPSQKVYISPNDLIFQDNRFLVIEEDNLLYVNKIEQDDFGIFYYKSWLYGYCPRGHAYGPDGKCNGDNCLFS
jgi:hypothetical protein